MRVNFNYFVSDAVADYLVDAVRMVARDGWRLLGDYRFDTVDRPVAPPRRAGRAADQPARDLVRRGPARMPTERLTGGEDLLAEHLRDGAAILAAAAGPDLSAHPGQVSADFEHLRWFDLPDSWAVSGLIRARVRAGCRRSRPGGRRESRTGAAPAGVRCKSRISDRVSYTSQRGLHEA